MDGTRFLVLLSEERRFVVLLFLLLAFVLSELFVAQSQAAFTLLCWGSNSHQTSASRKPTCYLQYLCSRAPRVTSVRISKVAGDAQLCKVSNDRRHVIWKN